MTIPTDGRIDLDALAELAKRLRNSPYMKALTTEAADALDNFIDLARRAAIPSEQGEAVAWQKWHDDEAGPGWDWYISKTGNMDAAIAKELREESATLIVNALNRLATTSPSPPALDGAGREGWQPIETAPRDGTTIIAWGPYNLEPYTVRWGPQRVGKEGWNSTWDGSRVIASETDFGTEYAEPDPLSHWMPLPAPPKETP